MNWIDWLIILFILIALVDGYIRGFLLQFIELTAFTLAIILGLLWYRGLADWLIQSSGMSALIAKPVAFLGIWLAIDIGFSAFLRFGYRRLPKIFTTSWWNRTAGFLPAFIKSVAYLGLALTILLSLPFSSVIKAPIEQSVLSRLVVSRTNFLIHALERSLGGSITQTFNFLTTPGEVSEQPTEVTPVPPESLAVEPELEQRMLVLLNEERTKAGLGSLTMDDELRPVARAHSRDMWVRGFFDHINPDGQDPFHRMEAAGVEFLNAGENLALAPSVEIGHYGLMRSPSHRDNILSPDFSRVGIGIISAGVDGLMITQNFRN